MKAQVVYESMFGNTREVAAAIADGLAAHVKTGVAEIGDYDSRSGEDVDLLVAGGPTHTFGLSWSRTRADAASRATMPVVSRGAGLREWLADLPKSETTRNAATFDTRVHVRGLPGSAARGAARRLRRRGYRLVVAPESFWVTGPTGPVADGELERARAWGDRLGRGLHDDFTTD
jgi:flavodoxin-like protein